MLALVILASALGVSRGTVWLTPDVQVPGGPVCRLSNDSGKVALVRVEGLARDGGLTYDSGPFRLAAGAVFQTGTGARSRRCRFTFEGAAGVRGEALVFDAERQEFSAHPATPARTGASFAPR